MLQTAPLCEEAKWSQRMVKLRTEGCPSTQPDPCDAIVCSDRCRQHCPKYKRQDHDSLHWTITYPFNLIIWITSPVPKSNSRGADCVSIPCLPTVESHDRQQPLSILPSP